VKFPGPAHGFPWAWDEEVAAGVAQWKQQDAQLEAESRVVAGGPGQALLHRGVRQAVGPAREWWDVLDAKVVVAQDAARWEQLAWQGQRDVPRPSAQW
jgi:hypothetical protein